MQLGVHYDHSYTLVASWISIRLLMTMPAVHRWHTEQLDYAAVFSQALVERKLYMKIQNEVNLRNKSLEDYILKLQKNTYGQENTCRV